MWLVAVAKHHNIPSEEANQMDNQSSGTQHFTGEKMISFKDFKSQVYHVLECSTTSNGKLGLDEIMLLAIYHLNQDDNGFRHSSDKSILLTESARMLLFSVVRKCLRDASSEATLVVSCYILNSLAQVVTENEQS
ncbi:MAG: hypothetical protein ACK55I_20555, partial [bacterium]